MGQLDKTDVEILQVLQKDAKVNTKELSREAPYIKNADI